MESFIIFEDRLNNFWVIKVQRVQNWKITVLACGVSVCLRFCLNLPLWMV